MQTYLVHHGVKGQKWGIRRYQNEDGTLTEAGRKRYGRHIRDLEKKAIKATYKKARKAGGSFIFPSFRMSTGKNYKKAQLEFYKRVANDKKYKDLSKKAFDAEKSRLMYEKNYINDDEKYEKMLRSKERLALEEKSKIAAEAKIKRVDELSKQYIDTIKNAKLDDLNISDNRERETAKKYISSGFDDFYWDENLEYTPDLYYYPGIEKLKFKNA